MDLNLNGHYSFWTDRIQEYHEVKIMVKPDKQKEFEDHLTSEGVKIKMVVDDVQKLVDATLKRPKVNRLNNNYAWEYYQTLDEINEWLENIVSEHSDIASIVNIGTTFEGRDIKGVKIDFMKRDKPVIGFLEGGIHSREWISPATMTWVINEFLTSSNPDIRSMAENVVWYIFPVVNPDGYEYSFTNLQQEGTLIYYLAFHSFSQMVLIPYSHVEKGDVLEVPNYGDLHEIIIKAMDKLTARHNTTYVVGTSKEILYETSGGSFDWARGVADIPIVYLYELRDLGAYGFLLPPEQIISNNEEVMDSLVELDRVTRQLNYYRSNGYVLKFNALIILAVLFVGYLR
ncbi:zinc carboxypeptidase A 1-like isoform X3 [Hyposmocoma kahamanoa]|uniref:zinc carboxypeptidase A 1-like isoform X3 n=1 Tax=Hyposmocoma kahamanoa TaxID=1477025 RepID=UPI000E6D6B20|nr:zinc carboxypeptidase A 1-like isoform X3 [Hyposmocoma kahamanoa]